MSSRLRKDFTLRTPCDSLSERRKSLQDLTTGSSTAREQTLPVRVSSVSDLQNRDRPKPRATLHVKACQTKTSHPGDNRLLVPVLGVPPNFLMRARIECA